MDTKQVYSIVTAVNQQAFGGALAVVDTTGLIALGNTVLSSTANTEAFLDTLAQRIGKTIISFRKYTNKMKGLVLDDFEYGAILQKIKVKMPTPTADASYDLEDGQSVDHYKVAKPEAEQKFFVTRTPYSFYITVEEDKLKEAFTSEVAMGGFISAIFGEVRNAIDKALEDLGRLCIANLAVHKVEAGKVVNLLTEYNTVKGNTEANALTADKALMDADFLNYATRRINETIDGMQELSTNFNDGSSPRFTPESDMRVFLLNKFVRSAETVSQFEASRALNALAEAGNYQKMTYWQSFNKGEEDKIHITQDGTEKEVDNVIGVIMDRNAAGIYKMSERVATTPLNAAGLYYNTFYHEKQLWFNDLAENGVVFTLD